MRFSRQWCQFFDVAVPAYVKKAYLPRPGPRLSKDLSFNEKDFAFFSPSVRALSGQLGSERQGDRPLRYFSQARNRSAYLLYLLPFQAAKIAWIMLSGPLGQAAKNPEVFRILDLGSGPATATLAALFSLIELGIRPRVIEITLVDNEGAILRDAENILKIAVSEYLPELKGQIRVQCIGADWESARLPEADLVFCAHLLNERRLSARAEKQLIQIARHNPEHGVLFVEPATRSNSQLLIHIRETLIQAGQAMRAPCFHSKRCPLAENRDWCHTSAPVSPPGKWLARFGREISESGRGKREFLKFSYLWAGSSDHPALPSTVRILSDAIPTSQGPRVIVCQPDRPRQVSAQSIKGPFFRGSASELVSSTQGNRNRVR